LGAIRYNHGPTLNARPNVSRLAPSFSGVGDVTVGVLAQQLERGDVTCSNAEQTATATISRP
jgi:hypothetical protein